jgi:hypothetical protein
MVVVEEKASAAEMLEADNDVRKKFVFLPHYDQLSYVIGISIAGDEVKMYRHWREPPPSPSSDCVVFNLQDQGDCLRYGGRLTPPCITEQVSISCWCCALLKGPCTCFRPCRP